MISQFDWKSCFWAVSELIQKSQCISSCAYINCIHMFQGRWIFNHPAPTGIFILLTWHVWKGVWDSLIWIWWPWCLSADVVNFLDWKPVQSSAQSYFLPCNENEPSNFLIKPRTFILNLRDSKKKFLKLASFWDFSWDFNQAAEASCSN